MERSRYSFVKFISLNVCMDLTHTSQGSVDISIKEVSIIIILVWNGFYCLPQYTQIDVRHHSVSIFTLLKIDVLFTGLTRKTQWRFTFIANTMNHHKCLPFYSVYLLCATWFGLRWFTVELSYLLDNNCRTSLGRCSGGLTERMKCRGGQSFLVQCLVLCTYKYCKHQNT